MIIYLFLVEKIIYLRELDVNFFINIFYQVYLAVYVKSFYLNVSQ